MAQRMRVRTGYDYAHLLELQRVVGRAITKQAVLRTRLVNLVWGCVGLLASVTVAARIHWLLALVFGLLSVFVIVRSVCFYQLAALSVRLTMDKNSVSTEYQLEKNYLLAVTAKGSGRYEYTDGFCLLETEKNLYFIMQDGQGLVLDKENIQGGTPEELRIWMEERSGKKAQWMGKSRPDQGV